MSELDERVARLEVRLDDHLRAAAENNKENAEAHAHIIDALAKQHAFQTRIRYVTGTALLLIGTAVGFIIHHAEWLWNVLPMHRHTH